MKLLIFTIFLHFFLNSNALPLKMLTSFHQRPLPLTHNLMYVEYMQPPHQQSGGIGAYSDGQLLGTETYAKDCPEDKTTDSKIESNIHESYNTQPDTTSDGFDQNNQDVYDKTYVEQYPQIQYHETGDNQPPQDGGVNLQEEIDEKVIDSTEQAQLNTTPISDEGKPTNSNDLNPVRTSVLNTEAYIPPKKRVYVDLEYPNVDEGYQNTNYFHQNNERKPSTTQINQHKPATTPFGTYFPLHFGDSSGSTIAVANSFSTGSGGSAVSHAIAYGNPNSGNPSKKGHLVRNKF